MNRILLSSTNTDSCIDDPYVALSEEVSHHDSDEAFSHVYYVMVFVASLWFVGKLFTKVGMPALVGEIIFGMLFGPNLLNFVGTHGSEFLVVIGEIGLIMLVVEAGIDVDIGMLKLIGPRGLGIAILGSIIPLSMGFIISILFKQPIQSAIAIGSCFAPTSMGIALNVLKKAKILNTPTGQLIIAAAILDDVIALIILSELSAMKHPTIKNILLPLLISPILILVIGYLAINYIPKIIKKIMTKIPEQHHENSILALLFICVFLLIPACHYLGSSHLLGAFLAGLMFCTDHTIHHVWAHQIKRVLQWLLRIFFSCTIGFAIPIQEFKSIIVLKKGFLYCLCMFGKIVTGFFSRPLNKKEFLTVGFSMSAWGEFAFIIATASFSEGTIDKESFSSVLLAVLLSVIISPYLLSFTISYYEKAAQRNMDAKLAKYEDTNLHPVYFAINTKARGQWGHQDKILHEIFKLNFQIIDFRSWHAPEYNHSHHKPLTKESFYVMDTELLLPPTMHLSSTDKKQLKNKVKQIRKYLKQVLGNKSIIIIKRWLPGVLAQDDQLDKKDLLFGQKIPKTIRRPSYCRREAFKQAHSIMSSLDWDYETEINKKEINKNNKPLSPLKDRVNSNSNHKSSVENENNNITAIIPQNPSTSLKHSQSDYYQNEFNDENNINMNEFPIKPSKIQKTKSMPNKPKSPKKSNHVRFNQIKLIRQFSDPKEYHTGMGHGGKAGGAGALPFTNKIINIHDHFQPSDNDRDSNHAGDMSPEPIEPDSDASISLIYGDEDAYHHKLPQYETGSRRQSLITNIAANNNFNLKQHSYYIQKPTTIAENSNELHDLTKSKDDTIRKYTHTNTHTDHTNNSRHSFHNDHDIEIITTDINGDVLESSYDNHYETPTNENNEAENNKYLHNMAITVTSIDNLNDNIDNPTPYTGCTDHTDKSNDNTPPTTIVHVNDGNKKDSINIEEKNKIPSNTPSPDQNINDNKPYLE